MGMEWGRLLSRERYDYKEDTKHPDVRSPFQKDIDRIIFSGHFRRLGRKTQVHPLNENDHIHTRLSHSLETSSVGRSIGLGVGEYLLKEKIIDNKSAQEHIGQIVQAACLAHDIGNPPFGHAGERAIKTWFKQKKQSIIDNPLCVLVQSALALHNEPSAYERITRQYAKTQGFSALFDEYSTDFFCFDGNAMSFRILTHTGFDGGASGMRPTYATLGAMLKYPHLSDNAGAKEKFSCFHTEKDALTQTAEAVGLIKIDGNYKRHPLAHIVEAADDICYRVMDIEDALELGLIKDKNIEKYYKSTLDIIPEIAPGGISPRAQTASIRARIIHKCIDESVRLFIDHYSEIMEGEFEKSLMSAAKEGSMLFLLRDIYNEISKGLFLSKRKVQLEIGANLTIGRILDCFLSAAHSICSDTEGAAKSQISVFLGEEKIRKLKEANCPYESIMFALDYVSGMTDQYAVILSKRFAGLGEF